MSARPGRAAGRADRRRRRRGRGARRSSSGSPRELLSNPLIEALRGRGAGRRVVARGWRRVTPDRRRRLPGLELRPRRAQRRSSSPARSRSTLWHEQASLDGVAAVLLPGRLRLRRLPPGRRHRPVQPGHARRRRVRRRRRPRPRDLQRLPGPDGGRICCPARCSATAACGSCGREVAIAPERLDTPFTRRDRRAAAAADAGRPRRGLLLRRRRRRSTSSSATARSCSATSTPTGARPAARAIGRIPNGSLRAIAGVMNAARQRRGADAPPGDARSRRSSARTTGSGSSRSFVESAAERAAGGGASRAPVAVGAR